MVYMLCFQPGLDGQHHYTGYTSAPLEMRLGQHLSGAGSRWTREALESGCVPHLVAKWPTAGEGFERWLKRQNRDAFCPLCCRAGTLAQPLQLKGRSDAHPHRQGA